MCHNGNELQAVHETYRILLVTLNGKGHNAATAIGDILLCQSVVLAALEAAVVHPFHLRVVLKVLGNLLCILAVAWHAQVQCLESNVQQECILGGHHRTQVTHHLCNHLCNVSSLAEVLCVHQAVVAVIGLGEACELVVLRLPVEVSAVNHATAYGNRMAVHVLCGRVCHNVGAPLERAAVHRCGESVVNNQGHTVAVSNVGKLLNVEHVHAGVRDCLAEQRLSVRAERLLNLLGRSIGINESNLNAHLLHCYCKQVVCSAVDSGCRYKVVARLANVQYRVEVRSLPR